MKNTLMTFLAFTGLATANFITCGQAISNEKLINTFIEQHGIEWALFHAISEDNTKVAKLLLQHENIDPNKGDSWANPLCAAIAKGNINMIKLLLQHEKIDVKIAPLANFFHSSILVGNIDIANLILEHEKINGKVDITWRSGLHIIKRNKVVPMAKISNKSVELIQAVFYKDLEAIKQLLKCKDLDVNKYKALHCACYMGCIDIVQALLQHEKINVNLQGVYNDQTPLHLAINKASLNTIKILLQHEGIDANLQNKFKKTPLDELATRLELSSNTRIPLDETIERFWLSVAPFLEKGIGTTTLLNNFKIPDLQVGYVIYELQNSCKVKKKTIIRPMTIEDYLARFDSYCLNFLNNKHAISVPIMFTALYYRMSHCSSLYPNKHFLYYTSLNKAYTNLKASNIILNQNTPLESLPLTACLKRLNFLEKNENQRAILKKNGLPVTIEEDRYKDTLIKLRKDKKLTGLNFKFR